MTRHMFALSGIDTWDKGQRGTKVVLHSIIDGDHAWPKKRSHHVDATKLIWEFFTKHGRGKKNSKKKQKRQR